MILRKGSRLFLSSGLLLAPSWAFCESASLTQLRMAAGAAENSVYAPTGEAAASANTRWSENGEGAVQVPQSAGRSPVEAPATFVSRPNLAVATPTVEPKDPAPDPLPPSQPKGWQGFYLGFLGVEGKALSMLSSTGQAAIPLLILLQPIVLAVGLVSGLLGIFGVRL